MVAFGLATQLWFVLLPAAALLAGTLYLTRGRVVDSPFLPVTLGLSLGAVVIAALIAFH
jgi:hypothetical protein